MLLLIFVSVALMTVDHRTQYINTVRSGLAVMVYPLQYAVNLPADFLGWASETFVTRRTLEKENSELRTQNHLLKAQLQKLTFIESENVHLRELLQSSKRAGERVLIAELLAVDLDPYKKQVVINKGSNQDLYVSQPLVDAHGVMGKLVHVNPFTSTALLITDPSNATPVQVNRNGLRAIAIGTGEGSLELPHLPNNADIQVGDLLVSSGLACVYPVGYPVARVTEVKTNPSLPFAEILAEPVADLQRSREVLLVWPSVANLPPMQNPCEIHKQENNP